MPRGGYRERAGRKSSWASGCSFSETILIRVPKMLKNELLEIAHRVDAGETIDLVDNSIQEENSNLKLKVRQLEDDLAEAQSSGESFGRQLELPISHEPYQKDYLYALRDDVLSRYLSCGKQSKAYKEAQKAFTYFIKDILSH